MTLTEDVNHFRQRKLEAERLAQMRLSCRLLAGIDFDKAICSARQQRTSTIMRLKRIGERERLRGLRQRPGYDLKRHAGLKMAVNALRQGDIGQSGTKSDR